MFAQLKKKIEDKENANIPHVAVASPLSPLRDNSVTSTNETENVVDASSAHEITARTRRKSNEEKSQINMQSRETNAEQLEQKRPDTRLTDENESRQNHASGGEYRNQQQSEKKTKDFIIQHLQEDKLELEKKLQETTTQLKRIIQSKENTEELESFQTQELAKIKHLLLISQQELSQKEETIRSCRKDLEATNLKLSRSDAEVRRLHQEFDTTKIFSLQLEKKALEEEVDRLKQDALRNSSILETKDETILQLQERVSILEKRLNDTNLTGDEMTQAVLAERTVLEKKLEERNQELSEIKTTWSEKIHSLETQIFHLNKKMAEDSEESSQFEKEVGELRIKLQDHQEKLWATEEQMSQKRDELEDLKSCKKKLEDLMDENDATTKNSIDRLQSEMASLVKEHSREKQEQQARINKLVAAQSEHIEKDIELERHITELEDENRRQKADLTRKGKECNTLKEETATLRLRLSDLENQVKALEESKSGHENELGKMTKTLDERQKSIHSLTEEYDRLMMRNAELSHDLELLRRETEEEGSCREKEREDSESNTLQLKNELQDSKNKIVELDSKLANNIESSSKVMELKNALSNYENEVADKNKTIKLQQQRLADMKKALQKELKAQTDSVQADFKPSQSTGSRDPSQNSLQEDINFKYLKHVVFKFMTSSEYEGQHLVKAICALLHFDPEEERLIKDTLEWKSSWFGVKPQPSRAVAS